MSTERDLIPEGVAEALGHSAEPMSDETRTLLRKRVMGAVRHDARAHYFASIPHRVAATVAAFAVLGSGVAFAANNALPGEPLYALKRVAEDALIELLPPGALERQLLLGVAGRRAGEAADLAAGGAVTGRVDEAIQQVRAAVREAAANGATITEQEAQQIQQQAQDAPQQTREAIEDAVTGPTTPQDETQQAPGGPNGGGTSGNTSPGNPDAPGDGGEAAGGGSPH